MRHHHWRWAGVCPAALVARYGSESVFRDIDSMPAGVDLVPSGVWLELKVA
jgi:hypothetical protein